jgi:hypothetical protein
MAGLPRRDDRRSRLVVVMACRTCASAGLDHDSRIPDGGDGVAAQRLRVALHGCDVLRHAPGVEKVVDPFKAIVNVQHYRFAVAQIARSRCALRPERRGTLVNAADVPSTPRGQVARDRPRQARPAGWSRRAGPARARPAWPVRRRRGHAGRFPVGRHSAAGSIAPAIGQRPGHPSRGELASLVIKPALSASPRSRRRIVTGMPATRPCAGGEKSSRTKRPGPPSTIHLPRKSVCTPARTHQGGDPGSLRAHSQQAQKPASPGRETNLQLLANTERFGHANLLATQCTHSRMRLPTGRGVSKAPRTGAASRAAGRAPASE